MFMAIPRYSGGALVHPEAEADLRSWLGTFDADHEAFLADEDRAEAALAIDGDDSRDHYEPCDSAYDHMALEPDPNEQFHDGYRVPSIEGMAAS